MASSPPLLRASSAADSRMVLNSDSSGALRTREGCGLCAYWMLLSD